MNHDYGVTLASALATQGGHLFIERGGFSLHCESGWLSGYDCEPVEAAAISARLPIIDGRKVAFGKVAELALRGPMIAVGKPADPPPGTRYSMRRSSRSRRLTRAPAVTSGTCLGAEGGRASAA